MAILCASAFGQTTAVDWLEKGNALNAQGKYNESIQAYDRAIEINSNYAEAWYNKGNALNAQGNYNGSIKAFDRAIEINPKYAEAWNNKGNALYGLGKYGEAIKAYDKAIEIDSKYAEAWHNKGNALSAQGKYNESIRAYEMAVKINPKYALSNLNANSINSNSGGRGATVGGQVASDSKIEGPCDVIFEEFAVCSGQTLTKTEIMQHVSCDCAATPEVSNIQIVDDHWEYTITCQSERGPATGTGIVNIETPCTPTFEPFTICSRVQLTTDMIMANGTVTCGTGVCDTTPLISDIHIVGDHWEYTITCTTAIGCSATVTGMVNIETVCMPTSEAFTVFEGVTPTADQILVNGAVSCGDCDATPAISNIHIVGDHWEYTITCTTDLVCTATGTGRVNIGPPCDIDYEEFTWPFCYPENSSPTNDEIIQEGDVRCTNCEADATPVISNIHFVNSPEGRIYSYNITCKSGPGGEAKGIGFFKQEPCALACTAVAPDICACINKPLSEEEFIAQGVKCAGEGDCSVIIDDTDVNYAVSGWYTYRVACGYDEIDGMICVDTLPCDYLTAGCQCGTKPG